MITFSNVTRRQVPQMLKTIFIFRIWIPNQYHTPSVAVTPRHTSIFFSSSIVRAGDAIYVRVGDHDLTQKYGSPGAQTLRVATTYIHHNHNSQTLDNDIAILKLHGEADLKEGVCLVCLPARGTSQQAGKKCTVTGYGYMGESELLQLVQVVQWGGGYCNLYY